jgi:hypothetical protein
MLFGHTWAQFALEIVLFGCIEFFLHFVSDTYIVRNIATVRAVLGGAGAGFLEGVYLRRFCHAGAGFEDAIVGPILGLLFALLIWCFGRVGLWWTEDNSRTSKKEMGVFFGAFLILALLGYLLGLRESFLYWALSVYLLGVLLPRNIGDRDAIKGMRIVGGVAGEFLESKIKPHGDEVEATQKRG